MFVQLLASSGAGSAVPGTVPTRPSNICRATRNVSPSLAKAGSRTTGSDDAAKTNVPPLASGSSDEPSSRPLSAQAVSVRASTPRHAGQRAGRPSDGRRSFCSVASFTSSCRAPSRVGRDAGARPPVRAAPPTLVREVRPENGPGARTDVTVWIQVTADRAVPRPSREATTRRPARIPPGPRAAPRCVARPAASAEARPVGESSIATAPSASTPSSVSAVRYGSGEACPCVTRSPVTTEAKTPGGSWSTTACAIGSHDIVTRACGTPRSRSRTSSSTAPGRHGAPRRMRAVTWSLRICTIAAAGRSTPPCSITYSAETISGLPTSACACASFHSPPWSRTSAYSASIHEGSVSTRVPSRSHSTAVGRAGVG